MTLPSPDVLRAAAERYRQVSKETASAADRATSLIAYQFRQASAESALAAESLTLLASARRKEVTDCGGCPFLTEEDTGALICLGNKDAPAVTEAEFDADTAPAWCPLRTAPVIVTLGTPGEKET